MPMWFLKIKLAEEMTCNISKEANITVNCTCQDVANVSEDSNKTYDKGGCWLTAERVHVEEMEHTHGFIGAKQIWVGP